MTATDRQKERQFYCQHLCVSTRHKTAYTAKNINPCFYLWRLVTATATFVLACSLPCQSNTSTHYLSLLACSLSCQSNTI